MSETLREALDREYHRGTISPGAYLRLSDALATPPVPAGDEREDVDWIADVQRRFGLGPEASTADVWRAHEAMIEEAEAEGYERGVRLTEGGNK